MRNLIALATGSGYVIVFTILACLWRVFFAVSAQVSGIGYNEVVYAQVISAWYGYYDFVIARLAIAHVLLVARLAHHSAPHAMEINT